MPARRRRATRATAALVAAALAGVVGAGVGTAHAKSLGGVTAKSLLGKSWPTDAITDNFNDTLGTSLATTTDTNGDVWAVGPGSFTIAATTTPVSVGVRGGTTAASEATVPGTVNASVGGDLHIVGTTSSFGLILNAAGTSSYAATLLVYDRANRKLTLERISPTGAITVLGAPYTVTLTSNYLRLTYSNGVYNAYVDNTTSRITYTEVGALRTEVEGYSRVGFGTISDNTSIFDNFQEYPL
jgi:hypothetical protein